MADAAKTTSNSSEGPRLEVLDRVKNIPVVHSAIEKTGSTYSYVKDSHHLINWALNQAEAGLHYATATAAPLAAPLAKKFEGQINAVDQKLCEGLNIVEQKVPIVKKPPQQVRKPNAKGNLFLFSGAMISSNSRVATQKSRHVLWNCSEQIPIGINITL